MEHNMQGLQILSGKYKGRKIYTQSKLNYRPTKSRVRKSLFDHLGDLDKKTVADLFSGTGVMGIEAASRGAVDVALVENDRNTVEILKKNIEKLKIPEVRIINEDVFHFLREGHKFNLLIADPPYDWYREEIGKTRIRDLIGYGIDSLNENGLFILEAPSKADLGGSYSKVYGDSKLIFWRKK